LSIPIPWNFEWFGYKLHLIVDVKLSLGYRITDTKAGDNEVLASVPRWNWTLWLP